MVAIIAPFTSYVIVLAPSGHIIVLDFLPCPPGIVMSMSPALAPEISTRVTVALVGNNLTVRV